MLRITMLLIFVLVGCVGSSPPQDESGGLLQQPETLHSDEDIQKIVPYNIREATRNARHPYDVPAHDVVPSGSLPRAVIFQKLGLSENRIRNFRSSCTGWVSYLYWQVSPSFSLCCMVAHRPELGDQPPSSLALPSQEVYGIRFFAHTEDFLPNH